MCEAQKNDADQIFKLLCRSLAEEGQVKAVSERFSALKTNNDRLGFAHDLIRKRDLLPQLIPDRKNNDLSTKYRQEGNQKFKTKKDEEALELYTKSIAFAEKDSQDLGLAFANRSAVLFEHQFYEECLQDIERAQLNNYPENLKDKLDQRRLKAEKLKFDQKKQLQYEPIPKLSSEPNAIIECSSDNIKINFTEEMGRHVTATKNIGVGDVIAIEKPYAKILLKNHQYSHCHNCLNLCHNLLPCQNCTFALFCGENCRKAAHDLYHKYECPILIALINFDFNKLMLVSLRIAICAKDECLNTNNGTGDVYRSQNYREIHELVANTEKRSTADLFSRAVQSALIFDLVQNQTSFFDDGANEGFFKELLLLHYQTGPSNFHEISELAYADRVHENLEIGAGAYTFLSLLNHSCSPNVVRHCHGTAIILRALRPIKEGQQLFDNYGYHYAVMAKQDRQAHLNKQYYFECTCKACINDWPLYQNLPVVDFDLEIDGKDLEQLRSANLETAKRLLNELLKKLAYLDDLDPCQNLADAQEIIKQCFAIFGNKHNRLS